MLILHRAADIFTRFPAIIGTSIMAFMPCSPIGFPSKTTFFRPRFSIAPAQMVKHATASRLLLDNINVSSDVFLRMDTPIVTPPSVLKELKDKSSIVNVLLRDKELARSMAPSNRIMFQSTFKDLRLHSGSLSSSASASPPVIRSGITVFKFSADPIRLLERSSSVNDLLFRMASTKRSHSKSSTSALHRTNRSNVQVSDTMYSFSAVAATGPISF
mmetsp:Transcript_24291/g.40552  ORF Transcript_24291/g.40552 Transcript_24291/m.40552 type:complete len:216 (+) Transcript_24291:146-793(+)